jgi:hypothetical protein
MFRKVAIGLAAAAIAMGGSTLGASAHHGGGGGGPHGGGGKVGGFGPHGGGGRYAMGDRYRHDHWRGRYGYRYYRPYSYSSGGSCWRWTPEGRIWVCGRGYGYGPSYSYGYYRGGWGRHRGGYGPGPHGGGRHFR